MQKIAINKSTYVEIFARPIRVRNSLFKYSPDSKELLDIIYKSRKKLPYQNLALPVAYLYYLEKYVGYSMHNFKDFLTLNESLINHIIVDKTKIINKIISAVESLYQIGIIYYDLHHYNILIKDDMIKLVDLDGAMFKDHTEYRIYALRNLLSLILEINIGFNVANQNYFKCLGEQIAFNDLYSPEVSEYLTAIFHYNNDVTSVPSEKYLHEFLEPDRIKKALTLI